MLQIIISAIKWSAIIILVCILSLCSIFILAQTRYGKNNLIRIADFFLNEKYNIQIETSGLTGRVPYDISIDRLVLHDGSGPWMDIQDVAFRFSPLYLFKGRFLITELKADSITLNRLPVVKKTDKPKKPFSLPSIVYHIGLKSLNVSRLSFGEEILGKPADFIIEAGVTEKEIGVKSRIFVNINRTDGVAGSAFLDAEVKGADPYLVINAGVDEPEKGIIGAVMGIDEPLSMSFKGSGRIKDWNGELSVNADQLAEIDARIDMQAREDLHLGLEGTALLRSSLVPDPLYELFDKEISFKINARVKEKNELFLDKARFESGNTLLELTSVLDIRHMTSEGSFTADMNDISPIGRLINKECSGELVIKGDFKGPVSSPSADIALTIRDLKSDIIRSDEFNAKALIELVSIDGSSGTAMQVNGSGEIQGLYLASVTDGLLEKRLTWELDMTGPYMGDLRINNLRLSGSLLTARISGRYNKIEKKGNFEAYLNTDSIARYSGILKMNIPKGIGASLNLNGGISGRSLDAHVSGKLDLNSNADETLIDIIGAGAGYTGDIVLSDNNVLTISNGKIDSNNAELTFSGLYDLNQKGFQGFLCLETNNLASFSSALKKDIRGSARIDASLNGTMDMVNIKSEFKAEDIALGNTGLQHLSGSIALSGQPLKNKGKVSIAVTQNGYSLKGDSEFKLDNKVLAFNDISFDGPAFNLYGNLSADMDNFLTQGEVNADFKDFSIINAFLGREIRGSAGIHLKSGTASGKNIINIKINGDNISEVFGQADSLDIGLELSGELTNPEIASSATLLGFTYKDISLKSVMINASGRPQDLDFTLTGTGKFVYGIIIQTSGVISLSSSMQSLGINSFQGEYGILPVNLTRPFKVSRSNEGIEFERMEFNIMGGIFGGYGSFSEESINFNMNFNDMPASLLQLAGIDQLEGNATGSVILSGTLKQPAGKASFTLNDMRLRETQHTNLPSLKLTAEAQLQSGRLEADLLLDTQAEEPFELKMNLPFMLSILPFSFSFPEEEDISGRVSGEMDIANIYTLAGIYDQKFKGNLSVALDIAGTIKSPEVAGEAKIKKGGYENYNTGTLIKDITTDISVDSKRFVFDKISGTDGDEGKVTGKGWFDFSPSRMFPYSLSLNVKNMIFYRSNTLSFTVSGKPTMSGTLHDHTLTGRLSVEKGEYRIPERLPAEITELEVTEINGPEQEQTQDQKQALKKSVIKMDIAIESTGQVYLTGRGLNSEWKGDINIKGPTNEPVITGRLSVLRGSYNFLGRRFDLTEGRIDLDGTYPMKPYLDVTGEAETSEITAIINLTGELKKPEVTLTSEPALPSDEILSQILFGKNVSQITPLQAIELGNALNSMMGNSKYDIFGSTRKMLGVDQLELVQSEADSDESAVSVGKYLREDVYVELEKGLGVESGKASVTWEATPNITIDTEMRENSSNGIGINWKWDY